MQVKEAVTIVTPTYNRAYILDKCYESLKAQTCKSFVWMIIDDGSTDNTEELVANWIQEGIIEIVYYKKENGGKASCLNFSFDHVNTEYYACLDSDDTFTPNAVELAIKKLKTIKNNDKYSGILALRTSPDGNVLGGKQIPQEIKDTTLSELTSRYKIRSELICFYKTNKVTKYRFPEIAGEKFISPGYLDLKIGRQYRFLVSRESYCICEYLSDGLTKNKNNVIRKNPKGYTLVIRESFDLTTNPLIKCKNCIMYIAGSILSGDKAFLKNSPHKTMTIAFYPLGWLAYMARFKLRK